MEQKKQQNTVLQAHHPICDIYAQYSNYLRNIPDVSTAALLTRYTWFTEVFVGDHKNQWINYNFFLEVVGSVEFAHRQPQLQFLVSLMIKVDDIWCTEEITFVLRHLIPCKTNQGPEICGTLCLNLQVENQEQFPVEEQIGHLKWKKVKITPAGQGIIYIHQLTYLNRRMGRRLGRWAEKYGGSMSITTLTSENNLDLYMDDAVNHYDAVLSNMNNHL